MSTASQIAWINHVVFLLEKLEEKWQKITSSCIRTFWTRFARNAVGKTCKAKQSKACPGGDHFQCPRTRIYTSHWTSADQACEKRRTVKGKSKSGENLWSDGRHLEAPVKRIFAPGKLQVLVPRVGKYCQGEILTWECKVWKYSWGILVFANSIIQLKVWLQIKFSQVWWRTLRARCSRRR